MSTKICTSCKTEKSITEFFRASHRKDGLQSSCKSCNIRRARVSMSKKPDKYVGYRKKMQQAMDVRYREWKEQQCCCCCDERSSVCLDLHHLDPTHKEYTVSRLRNSKWEKFLQETQKCVVICSNCHRKLHAGMITHDKHGNKLIDN